MFQYCSAVLKKKQKKPFDSSKNGLGLYVLQNEVTFLWAVLGLSAAALAEVCK